MQLTRYDNARRALYEAHSIDEVKDIRDKAAAMKAYALQAKDRDLVTWATDIIDRAARRAGEMLREMAESGQRDSGGRGKIESRPATQLSDLGVSKSQSSRWQKLAEMPEDKFEERLEARKKAAIAVVDGVKKDSQLVTASLSNEHYTPKQYIEAAREVMGTIDLDPASCESANAIVKATRFYSIDDDGIAQDWAGNLWINPPYGGLAGKFAMRAADDYNHKGIDQAVLLVNAHCTDTAWFQPLWDGLLCFTDHRINFYGDEERSGSTHGSVFVYFGHNEDKFAKIFSEFGPIVSRIVL